MATRPPHSCAANKALDALAKKGFVRVGDPASEPKVFWHPDPTRAQRFIVLTSLAKDNQAIAAIPIDAEQL
jgi:hypothetical protein